MPELNPETLENLKKLEAKATQGKGAPCSPKRELSSYAFNVYGGDARLYNGIHDLETRLAEAESVIERQAKEIEELRKTLSRAKQAMQSAWYELLPGPRQMGDQFIRQDDMEKLIDEISGFLPGGINAS